MADGRKNNGGHSTKGFAGRPKKADEVKVAESFRAVLSDGYVIEKLSEKVEQGDMKAIELWLAYVYGKPKQSVDHTTDGEAIQPPVWSLVDAKK
jgi:hypothetical protein